jgi:hypothetical protein
MPLGRIAATLAAIFAAEVAAVTVGLERGVMLRPLVMRLVDGLITGLDPEMQRLLTVYFIRYRYLPILWLWEVQK